MAEILELTDKGFRIAIMSYVDERRQNNMIEQSSISHRSIKLVIYSDETPFTKDTEKGERMLYLVLP